MIDRLTLILSMLLISLAGFAQQGMPSKIKKELGPTYLHFDPGFLQNTPIDSSGIETVWSRTVDSVVIGRTFRGEYIQDNDTTMRLAILYPMLLGDSYVTKGEFLEFRKWIQDSIARTKLFYGLEEDADARKLLKQDKIDEARSGGYREEWRTDFDWKVKLDYKTDENVPILADMYYPQPQRFRKRRDIDLRKMYFESVNESKKTRHMYPIFIDSYNWALGEKHDFSAKTVLAFLDDQLYLDAPITHIEPFMAVAYCEWKSKQLTKLLGSQDHRIECRLPNAYEVEYAQKTERATIEIPAYDHTDDWQITNDEFHEFADYVLDSLQREYVYYNLEEDEEALSLLKYQKRYFDEGALEFIDVNPRFRELNRWYLNLDFKKKLETKDPTYAALLSEFPNTYRDSIPFRYWWMDAIDFSVKGKLIPDPDQKRTEYGHYLVLTPKARTDNEPHGEDLVLEWWRGLAGFGARDHANLQRFRHRKIVALPLPNAIPSNEETADITYEQALAFYNWKFRIDKYKEDERGDWQQFVFPTEAEFKRIKNGERIVHPATSISYEFPVFRMVVELTPL